MLSHVSLMLSPGLEPEEMVEGGEPVDFTANQAVVKSRRV